VIRFIGMIRKEVSMMGKLMGKMMITMSIVTVIRFIGMIWKKVSMKRKMMITMYIVIVIIFIGTIRKDVSIMGKMMWKLLGKRMITMSMTQTHLGEGTVSELVRVFSMEKG
jgi:hypothetical protein